MQQVKFSLLSLSHYGYTDVIKCHANIIKGTFDYWKNKAQYFSVHIMVLEISLLTSIYQYKHRK